MVPPWLTVIPFNPSTRAADEDHEAASGRAPLRSLPPEEPDPESSPGSGSELLGSPSGVGSSLGPGPPPLGPSLDPEESSWPDPEEPEPDPDGSPDPEPLCPEPEPELPPWPEPDPLEPDSPP